MARGTLKNRRRTTTLARPRQNFQKSQHFFGEWARAGIFILVMGCWHEFCQREM